MTTFKIHPAIGIARLGNSDQFYLTPEQPGALPIECDDQGREITDDKGQPVRVSEFKESGDLSKIKRQAARFRVFAYEGGDDAGSEIKLGETFTFTLESNVTGRQKVKGTIKDIIWQVHLANKKASWYQFQETDGMHGYSAAHPLRNPQVTQPDQRRQLIIDPGPQSVSLSKPAAQFAQGQNPGYPQSFPPADISPNTITTLGELKVNQQDDYQRLIVLGGNGHSGSTGVPVITDFANNDGWFDDISDGPVTARIVYDYEFSYTDANGKPVTETKTANMTVQVPAWVVVGYPRYVPELPDMVTLDEALYDLYVRQFAYQPAIFGVPPYDKASNQPQTDEEWALWRNDAQFNPDYYPKYYAEIWPILQRPDTYKYVFDFDLFEGGDPHNTGTGGNLDQKALSQPPMHGDDPNYQHRQFIDKILRQPGQENLYRTGAISERDPNYRPRLMPMLSGNNPISNTAAEKFFRLTDTQLFLLKQWADGKFVNECEEWDQSESDCQNPWRNPPTTGVGIDRGVLSNMLGGAFCPGGELGWIIINPAIYSAPYRIHHAIYQAGALSLPQPIAAIDGSPAADLASGLEPGDLTKYIGLPWQADFHECTSQNINITYQDWNTIELDSTGDPAPQTVAYDIPWWPAHRPMVVQLANPPGAQVYWSSGLSDNNAGDLQMVSEWNNLGFIKYQTVGSGDNASSGYFQTERNSKALGAPIPPGQRQLGQNNRRKKHV
ncbi:MAG: LodA/GoxA family CTQ-dependent oxidase [Wenzhouxiangellaceae bacterium]